MGKGFRSYFIYWVNWGFRLEKRRSRVLFGKEIFIFEELLYEKEDSM